MKLNEVRNDKHLDWWYHSFMTIQTLAQAIKNKKPAIIKEKGVPRYVVLDWAVYKRLQMLQENFIDELEDYREIHDSKVREYIREGTKKYLAGKSRPAEKLLAELQLVRDRPRTAKKHNRKS